jgi:hypothetical protein
MALADIGEALAYEAAFSMQAFENPEFPVDELGELSIEVSTKLRALAIIQLLVNEDSDGFHHNLIRSGMVRLAFLRRLQQAGIEANHHGVSGRYEPVLDLIVAGQFDSADQIGRLSPLEWRQGHEYEDDYCYAQILFLLIAEPLSFGNVEALASRFGNALDGKPDARIDVCLSLARGSPSDFEEAFEKLLKQRTVAIEADKARAETVTPEVTALRAVYIEGLAMLQLATRRGIKTEREYLYCPSLARVPMRVPFTE